MEWMLLLQLPPLVYGQERGVYTVKSAGNTEKRKKRGGRLEE